MDSWSISAQSPTPSFDCLRQYFVSSCSFRSSLFSSVRFKSVSTSGEDDDDDDDEDDDDDDDDGDDGAEIFFEI